MNGWAFSKRILQIFFAVTCLQVVSDRQTGFADSSKSVAMQQPATETPIAQQPVQPPSPAPAPQEVKRAEIVIYGFEKGLEGWRIPDWAKNSNDYVARDVTVSKNYAKEGSHSLEVPVEFPGGRWTGAYVEREVEVNDWSPFGRLSVEIFLPQDAPQGLKAKIILSVGEQWKWIEMNHAVRLEPGAWMTINVNLKPGSMDWKFFPDEAFRKRVYRLGVRVESDKEPVYSGSVFIDNICMAE